MSDTLPPQIGQVISIGDELTSGQRLDTNTQWLSQRLTDMGVHIVYHSTVADDLEANTTLFRDAIERADVVICTGGLGPTADDLTREALAAAVGVGLEENAAALENIRGMFKSRGRSMPARNALQALFPIGSKQILNPNGTAPGVQMRIERPEQTPCLLFALPGVPAEMKPMWHESVAPAIADSRPATRVTCHRRIKCFGAGESHIEAMLPDMIQRGRDPLVGITASSATITLRISASGKDETECMNLMEPTITEIRNTLGVLAYGEEDDEVEDSLVRLLRQHKKTLAVAEGATKGKVAQLLATADGQRDTFLGSTVHWSSAKEAPQHSSDSLLDEEQATEQAQSARNHFQSDLGLAISHLSRKDGDDYPSAIVALADTNGCQTKRFFYGGTEQLAQMRTSRGALNFVRLAILRNE